MDYHKSIENSIASYLEQRNLSQSKLAEMLNLTEEEFENKRLGREEFLVSEIIELGGILGMTAGELTGLED